MVRISLSKGVGRPVEGRSTGRDQMFAVGQGEFPCQRDIQSETWQLVIRLENGWNNPVV
jgi:hypothetical protein